VGSAQCDAPEPEGEVTLFCGPTVYTSKLFFFTDSIVEIDGVEEVQEDVQETKHETADVGADCGVDTTTGAKDSTVVPE
jgi:hypothetical protein